MSAVTSYDEYIERLAKRFCDEVKRSSPHREAIDTFCLAIAPFDLIPSITIYSDGRLGMTAICIGGEETVMRKLILAGYAIGVPVEKGIQFKGQVCWVAPVSGHGCVFDLDFTTTKD